MSPYVRTVKTAFVLSTHGWFLFNAVAGATLPVFALRTLGLSPFGLGLALAAGGAGGLLGALSATSLGARFGAGRIVIASIVGRALVHVDRWPPVRCCHGRRAR